ncbi:MAG: hypothetical protein EXX96DRAFT_557499 [Benjaminiella poitrasii]|nr:MAG: hypothetical protein EXX96DRAFT_557499 [Benjaminiella poitrasii]
MNMNQLLSSPQPIHSAVSTSGSSFTTTDSKNSNASTIELPPINTISSTSEKYTPMSMNKPPQFLEPIPMFESYRCENTFLPRIYSSFNLKEAPSLVSSSASSSCSESSNPPSPLSDVNTTTITNAHQQQTSTYSTNSPQIPCRYALLPSIQPKPNTMNNSKQSISRCPVAHGNNWSGENNAPMVDERGAPLSPTMRAASAAAVAASMQNHSGSLVADTFLNSISLSAADEDEQSKKKQNFNHESMPSSPSTSSAGGVCPFAKHGSKQPSFARVSFMLHGAKRPSTIGADQRMFLTKNAHIKRPRNAWIHFRCHYGQALKSQDPTLRAEEISKRASHRWARLSENEKKPWHDLAEQDKQAHKAAFPEYRYCPRRSNSAAMLAAKNSQRTEQSSMYKSISSRI